jgi:hypothetical protein
MPVESKLRDMGWRVTDIARRVAALGEQGTIINGYEGAEQDDSGPWKTPGGDKSPGSAPPTSDP